MKTLNAVEIFATGTWNGNKFVADDLKEIAEKTNELISKSTHRPPIKLGHSKKQILAQEDGQPALGWMENFKVVGTKLVADLKSIPDVLINSIKGELFKQLSVELTHHRNFGWFASGIAFLGSDLPAVKTLQDLQIYLSEKQEQNSTDNINSDFVLSFSEPVIINQEENMENDKIKELELSLKEKELQFKKREDDLAAKLAESKKKEVELSLKFSAVAFAEKKSAVVAEYNELVKEGILTPALFDDIEKEIDAQKTDNFSENSVFIFSHDLVAKIIENQEKKIELSETETVEQPEVEAEISIDEKVNTLINAKMESKQIDYFGAMKEVFSDQPGLKELYTKFAEEA